jgi:hypothetical protein
MKKKREPKFVISVQKLELLANHEPQTFDAEAVSLRKQRVIEKLCRCYAHLG